MSISSDLRLLADKAAKQESKLERITFCAYALCRTLGYCHGKDGAKFVGPPTVHGFIDTEGAVRQLIAALSDSSQPTEEESHV